jgi:hypothetical protein
MEKAVQERPVSAYSPLFPARTRKKTMNRLFGLLAIFGISVALIGCADPDVVEDNGATPDTAVTPPPTTTPDTTTPDTTTPDTTTPDTTTPDTTTPDATTPDTTTPPSTTPPESTDEPKKDE